MAAAMNATPSSHAVRRPWGEPPADDGQPDNGPARPAPVPTEQLRPVEAFERRMRGGPRRLRQREVAREVGVSLLSARKLWRALGFARVEDEDIAFTDGDVRALQRVVGVVRRGLVDEDTAISLARALGQTTDRLVSWQTEILVEYLGRAYTPPDGYTPPEGVGLPASPVPGSAESGETAGELPAMAVTSEIPVVAAAPDSPQARSAVNDLLELGEHLEALLVYSWRRQLAAVLSRMAGGDQVKDLVASEATVGFADLVSYTRLSQRLEQRELSVLVQRFEALASDVVTAGGGRMVKTIGDEVLFLADDPVAGAVIGLSLSEQMAVDDVVPDVRVGIAHGPVLRSLGDVFGATVNLASRLTSLAQPGTVVTDPETARRLPEGAGLVLVPQRRRAVRGYGQLQPLLIARIGPGSKLITLD